MSKELIKNLYMIVFSLYKYIKYPNCKIYTNFVLPNVNIGKGVIIRNGCKIQNYVKISDYTYINENTQIDQKVDIGKFCSISHGVKIGMANHPMNYFTTSPLLYSKSRGLLKEDIYNDFNRKKYTIIENDVLIGANVIIMSGIIIESGAIIGAGSIVTKNVPAYAIVVGNPARIIRYRFDSVVIEKLLKTKWWDKDIKILKSNIKNSKNIEDFIKIYSYDVDS